jgi:hypothetical protein
MASGRWRWEKATERGVRYDEVQVHQDRWGQWVLLQRWGQRGTALGQTRRRPDDAYPVARSQLENIHQRRLQRGYHPVSSRQPDR